MIPLDATNDASMVAAVDQIIHEQGRIDILINKEMARPTRFERVASTFGGPMH